MSGIDPNLIRALAKKHQFEVNWMIRGRSNIGFSPLDYAVRSRKNLSSQGSQYDTYLVAQS